MSSVSNDSESDISNSNDSTYVENKTFVYSSTIIFSIFSALCIIVLYINKGIIPFFNMIIWIGFPLFIYIISSVLNIFGQWLSCKHVNAGRGFLTAFTTLGFVYLSLLITKLEILRLPIGSLVAPLISSPDFYKYPLQVLEEKYPIILSSSVAYYVFWGVMFGQIITSGLSAACS